MLQVNEQDIHNCKNRTSKECEVRVNDEMVVNYCFEHQFLWLNHTLLFVIDDIGDNVLPVMPNYSYSSVFNGCGQDSLLLREMGMGTLLGFAFVNAIRCFKQFEDYFDSDYGYHFSRPHFEDMHNTEVNLFCQKIRSHLEYLWQCELESRAVSTKTSPDHGYVYVIQSETSSPQYKIGRSKDPVGRIKKLGVLLPFDIETIHVIETDNAVRLESDLHEEFYALRVRGEWFNLSLDDVNYLRSMETVNFSLKLAKTDGLWKITP